MNSLLQFKICVRKTHYQLQWCNLQLAYEDRLLFVSADLQVSLCRQQHVKCERSIRLLYPSSFCKIRSFIQRHKQNSIGVMSEHSNGSILITMLN
jgi:hypothetical protein